MKTFGIAIAVLASLNAFAATVDLSSSTIDHHLVDAEYKLIPTKTRVRPIPGCEVEGGHSSECEAVTVLESRPAIIANISYTDRMATSDDMGRFNMLSLELDIKDFSSEEIASLKAASSTWANPFSHVKRNFAKNLLKLEVKKVSRSIQVVDVNNSTFCGLIDGEVEPTCHEHIVFKPATTLMNEVTVSRK